MTANFNVVVVIAAAAVAAILLLLPTPRRFCFVLFVCLFVSRIAQKNQPIFAKCGGKAVHGPRRRHWILVVIRITLR